jgi:hypothetical protein
MNGCSVAQNGKMVAESCGHGIEHCAAEVALLHKDHVAAREQVRYAAARIAFAFEVDMDLVLGSRSVQNIANLALCYHTEFPGDLPSNIILPEKRETADDFYLDKRTSMQHVSSLIFRRCDVMISSQSLCALAQLIVSNGCLPGPRSWREFESWQVDEEEGHGEFLVQTKHPLLSPTEAPSNRLLRNLSRVGRWAHDMIKSSIFAWKVELFAKKSRAS